MDSRLSPPSQLHQVLASRICARLQSAALLLVAFLSSGCVADHPDESQSNPTEQADSKLDADRELDEEEWASLKRGIRAKFPSVSQLSVADLKSWLASNSAQPLILDVREPAEFEVSHLSGAVRASNEEQALAAIRNHTESQTVVLYCSVGYRSSELATALIELGYENVFNLEGSIFEWANSGETVYAGEDPVSSVHPYDSHWGRLLRRELWSDLSASD